MAATAPMRDREDRKSTRDATAQRFLFLQGPIGLFFSRLAQRLRDDGHAVHRINLHAGDRLFWRLPGALDYRMSALGWPEFLAECLDRWRVTDLLLFGDCRPFHQAAISIAAGRGVRVHVFEEGYLRPHWVTMESGGVNGNSSLPREPEFFRQAARSAPPFDATRPVEYSFTRRAAEDVLYHTAMVMAGRIYPGYRTHRPWPPYVEYAHGAGRFLRKPIAKRRLAHLVRSLAARSQPYYLFPLQLNSDVQIRHHFSSGRMETAIDQVVSSFARCAPKDTRLVLTEHPLETGVLSLKRVARRAGQDHGIASRLHLLEGGSPHELVRGCRGMITVNSTMGPVAMELAVPVIALGRAVYSMPGLTFQGGLDDFWGNAEPADPELFDAFRRVVAARTQIHGGFYSTSAIELAVQGAARRLEHDAAQVPAVSRVPQAREPDFGFASSLHPITR